MIDGYFGYYAMHEGKLDAYSRLLYSANGPAIMQQVEDARAQRRASLMNSHEMKFVMDYARDLNTAAAPVIEINGALSRDGYCNMGYEQMSQLIRKFADNSEVKSIGLKASTPGGNVDGVVGVAEAIRYARSKRKKVSTWGGFIASAGYFIASPSNTIFLDQQKVSEIGSIGVLMVHMDETEKNLKEGKKPTIIRADGSDQKARINSVEPLTDELIAEEKKVLNTLRGEFVGYVRRGRAGKLTTKEWESGAMFNSTEAKRIGLIDGTMGLSDWLEFLNN